MTNEEIRTKIKATLLVMGITAEDAETWFNNAILPEHKKTPQQLIDEGLGEKILSRLITLAQGGIGM